ncbi:MULTISPECIES: M48 family metalloprotease [unclassified Moraxella]|uniref:M48 family metalloprotease n=1 Tax=unclassified Moraxella TaxID=2685852 RepID=UPI003AF6A9A9
MPMTAEFLDYSMPNTAYLSAQSIHANLTKPFVAINTKSLKTKMAVFMISSCVMPFAIANTNNFLVYPKTASATSPAQSWQGQWATSQQSDGLIDNQQSLMIGEWALRQINQQAPLIDDPWVQDSLQTIIWQINAVARPEAPSALVIINDRQINAFAVPSGLIGLNVGLVDKARTMDELASVISHEIAHVSQRHYQHRNDEKTKQLLMQAGGMLAGIVAAKASNSNTGTAVMMGSQAISANSVASFSREQEREADRIGMQIMAQAGYDVTAMPSFFATLDQQNPVKANAFIPSFVMSHPLTAERLSEARSRAMTYQQSNKTSVLNSSTQRHRQQIFDQLQWRIRYLAHLTNKNDLKQSAKTSDGAKLALAMQLMDERAYLEAQNVLQPLKPQIADFSNPLAVIVDATLNQKLGKTELAISQLTTLMNLLPERRDVKLYLSKIYLEQANVDNASKVLQLLQPLSKTYPKDLLIWQYLQQASQVLSKNTTGSSKTLHEINVLRYRANREFWQNQLNEAITSLTQAQSLAKTLPQNTALLATINQQMSQVQQANQFTPD